MSTLSPLTGGLGFRCLSQELVYRTKQKQSARRPSCRPTGNATPRWINPGSWFQTSCLHSLCAGGASEVSGDSRSGAFSKLGVSRCADVRIVLDDVRPQCALRVVVCPGIQVRIRPAV